MSSLSPFEDLLGVPAADFGQAEPQGREGQEGGVGGGQTGQ